MFDIFAASAALVLAATVAAPSDAASGASQANGPEAEPQTAQRDDADENKIICRREQTSGSRLGAKRICQTAAEWERQRRDFQQAAEKAQSSRWKSD